jgi:hypothetical protein
VLDLSKLPPTDLAYLSACVAAGRVLRRSKSRPTQFAKRWLSQYASENEGVVYLRKEQRLKYDQLRLDR